MRSATAAACSWPQLQWPGLLTRSWAAFWTAGAVAVDARPAQWHRERRAVTVPTALASASAPLVVIVTPATSISFFRPELDDFLQAPIGMERDEMPLSVLSALARLGLDPWKEADELSELSSDCATQRLAVLIVRLPGGPWTQAEARGIALRLIELLPSRSPDVPLIEKADRLTGIAGSPIAKMLLCAVLMGVALVSAASCDPSSGADMVSSRTTETAGHPAPRYFPKLARD